MRVYISISKYVFEDKIAINARAHPALKKARQGGRSGNWYMIQNVAFYGLL